MATHEVRQVLLQAVNHAVQHPDVTKSLSNAITKELGFQVEDGLSHKLPLRPGASLSQTRKILRRCTNEAIVVSEVLAVLIPIGDLFLSALFDAVPDSQWRVPPLPLLEHSEVEITQPKPDLTVGFKKTEEMRIGHALHVLRPQAYPSPHALN